jgi:hypothetical protein
MCPAHATRAPRAHSIGSQWVQTPRHGDPITGSRGVWRPQVVCRRASSSCCKRAWRLPSPPAMVAATTATMRRWHGQRRRRVSDRSPASAPAGLAPPNAGCRRSCCWLRNGDHAGEWENKCRAAEADAAQRSQEVADLARRVELQEAMLLSHTAAAEENVALRSEWAHGALLTPQHRPS